MPQVRDAACDGKKNAVDEDRDDNERSADDGVDGQHEAAQSEKGRVDVYAETI